MLAYRSNLKNKKNIEDMTVFSKDDCSLEDDPHKQKTFQPFITFIETAYKEYIHATDITKPFLQPIMVSYLFFVTRVLKDPKKALFLLTDFRTKLKRLKISIKLRVKIQMILIEEECLQEATIWKGNLSLDVGKVFSVFDKTDDPKLRIINFIEKKLEFLESLKAPCLDLNLLKSTGVGLTTEIQALLKMATEDPDFTHFSKPKDLFAYFIKEVLQYSKLLGFEFKNTHSYRVFKEESKKENTAYELIEKIQGSSTSQTFIIVVDDCTLNRGKIIRCTKQLWTRLNYSTKEVSGLNFDEVVVAVNYQNHTFVDDKLAANQDSDRKMCQVILKSRTGELIPAHGSIQHQIFDDVPCMVLLGEEEKKSGSDYFILCQQDGHIQGISSKLASSLINHNKPIGKFIHQILSRRVLESPSVLLDDTYTRKPGLLRLQASKNLNEDTFEIDFSVCPFGTKDTDSGIFKNFVVYLYPSSAGTLKDMLKNPPRMLVFSSNRLMSPKSIFEYQQSDQIPFESIPNSFADKLEKLQFGSCTEAEKSRLNTNLNLYKFGSQTSLLPLAYSSKILEAKPEDESERLDKAFDRKIEIPDDFEREDFESKDSSHFAAWVNQNDPTAYYGSMQGSSKRQRDAEKARQLINSHKLPISIESMRVLQLLAGLTLFCYLIIDHLDLTRKFEILSEMSGITSFPLTLMTTMAAFLGYTGVSLAAALGFFTPEIRMQVFYLVPGMFQNFFTTFQTQFEEYVLQSNPTRYYPDFTYEKYALNLTLPDSPFLNREAPFNEALDVLRGYMSNFLFDILKGFHVNQDCLYFFQGERWNYSRLYQLLSIDLFSRLSAEFDNLLLLLQLRIIVGAAVAVTIGASVLYIFFKLHRSSENLLSKFTRIPESEIDNEIASLKQKIAYLQGRSEQVVAKQKPGVYPTNSKKFSRSGVTISKKYKQLKQRSVLHILLSLVYCILFLLPFLIAYNMKRTPVNSCIPLIKQYKLIAESGAMAAALSANMVEALLMAAVNTSEVTLEVLNTTAPYLVEAKKISSSLNTMLNTIDTFQDDPYISKHLITVLLNLRNQSLCEQLPDALISSFCVQLSGSSTNVQFGVSGIFQASIENFESIGKMLEENPTKATTAKLTSDTNIIHQMFFSTITYVATTDVVDHYQSNFEEVAATVNGVFKNLLAVSLVYYCLLILLTLIPFLPWARKEYKKVRDIYTLLPTDVMISNPYIIAALKHR